VGVESIKVCALVGFYECLVMEEGI